MSLDLYSENILDHYKNPRNFGTLDKPDIKHKEVNTLCGDEIELFLKFDKEIVKEVKFNGTGCAISMAASSILSEFIKEKTLKELRNFTEGDMINNLGIQLTPARLKCGLLAWKTLHIILSKK